MVYAIQTDGGHPSGNCINWKYAGDILSTGEYPINNKHFLYTVLLKTEELNNLFTCDVFPDLVQYRPKVRIPPLTSYDY